MTERHPDAPRSLPVTRYLEINAGDGLKPVGRPANEASLHEALNQHLHGDSQDEPLPAVKGAISAHAQNMPPGAGTNTENKP